MGPRPDLQPRSEHPQTQPWRRPRQAPEPRRGEASVRRLRQHSNPMLAWIARIALETGMRSSEILTLTRSQVDVRRRVVRLTDTKNNEARLVPLTQAATEVFKQALNSPVRPLDCDLVFFGEPGRDGKRGPTPTPSSGSKRRSKQGSMTFATTTYAMRPSVGWSRRDYPIRRSPRSVVTSRCRCCGGIRILGRRIWWRSWID